MSTKEAGPTSLQALFLTRGLLPSSEGLPPCPRFTSLTQGPLLIGLRAPAPTKLWYPKKQSGWSYAWHGYQYGLGPGQKQGPQTGRFWCLHIRWFAVRWLKRAIWAQDTYPTRPKQMATASSYVSNPISSFYCIYRHMRAVKELIFSFTYFDSDNFSVQEGGSKLIGGKKGSWVKCSPEGKRIHSIQSYVSIMLFSVFDSYVFSHSQFFIWMNFSSSISMPMEILVGSLEFPNFQSKSPFFLLLFTGFYLLSAFDM